MQIVSRDNLHEMLKPILYEKLKKQKTKKKKQKKKKTTICRLKTICHLLNLPI